jgi:hypothetical protein
MKSNQRKHAANDARFPFNTESCGHPVDGAVVELHSVIARVLLVCLSGH